jgi:polygalacturonase
MSLPAPRLRSARSVLLALLATACGSASPEANVSGDDAAIASPGDARPDSTDATDDAERLDASAEGDERDASARETEVDAGDARATESGAPADASTNVESGDGGGPCGPTNAATVPLPAIGAGTFSVTSYGAVGDGSTDDTAAIQAALDAAGTAGGGTVSVPAGTFLSGPIVVHDATRLDLATGAVLEMLPMSRYPNQNAFITSNNAHDIALTGSGTIEGQGQDWWNALTANSSLKRPQEVSFSHTTRVLISGVHLQNSPEEHIWVKGDTDVTVTGITIETLPVTGQHFPNNTDGVDISADGVFFCNNTIACGDDNVVMQGTNIYVGYSQFGVGHGCSIGSGTTGGVSGVSVDHVTMNGTTAGIRMKSARDRGGLVTGLTYSNMTMTNVTNPVSIESYYPTLPSDPTTDTAQPITSTTPYWENITIKNLKVTGSPNAGTLWGLPEAKIANLVFDGVSIQATAGMDVFHATGVSFINGSSITVTSGPEVIAYDATVTGLPTHAYP